MRPAVFFDLDGVLADFVRGSFRLHGRSVPLREVVWGFPALIGFTGADDPKFWEPMGRDFWAGLDRLEDGFAFLRLVETIVPAERIGLLTSPCDTAGCLDGKRDWVAKHLPDYRRRLFVGAAKELFAGPGKILIDDNDANASRFHDAGGQSVLIPRPWNARSHLCNDEGRFLVSDALGDFRNALWSDAGTS